MDNTGAATKLKAAAEDDEDTKKNCPRTGCADELLPISFDKKRHTTTATPNNSISKSWRIRDRVSFHRLLRINVYLFIKSQTFHR